MKRRKVAILCLGIIALLHFKGLAIGNAAQHRLGYERVLKNAASNPFYKYGIYSSRIIAVNNPEVYLQGDLLFAELITTHSGYAQAYQEPVESMYLMEKFKLDSEPFSFEMVDFAKYKIIPKEEIYGTEIFLYPFIDERISPIHTTLKTKSIGDGLMVFNRDTLVDTNMLGAEAAGLHQKIAKLSQAFLKAKPLVEYKEDCLYQKLELP